MRVAFLRLLVWIAQGRLACAREARDAAEREVYREARRIDRLWAKIELLTAPRSRR